MFRRTRGVGRTMARTALIAGTATPVSGHVARRQQARYAQQEGAAAPAPAFDLAEELTKLAGLHERGILTDEEFSAPKARLLAI